MGIFDFFQAKLDESNSSELRVNWDETEDVGIVTHYNGKPLTGIAFGLHENGNTSEEVEMLNGQGTYNYADGNKYVGEWKDDKKSGQGTFTFASGNKYVGEWKDNSRNGQGTFTFASGNKYVGELMNGNFHGQGTMTHANGTVEKGLWENDEFIGE